MNDGSSVVRQNAPEDWDDVTTQADLAAAMQPLQSEGSAPPPTANAVPQKSDSEAAER